MRRKPKLKSKSEADANRTGFELAPMRNAKRKKKQSNSLKLTSFLKGMLLGTVSLILYELSKGL